MNNALLPHNKNDYLKQLVLIASLCLVSVLFFSFIGTILANFLFNINLSHQFSYTNLSLNETNALKLIQFFSAIGLFIIPPFIYVKLRYQHPFSELGITKKFSFNSLITTILIMLVVTPFLSFTININEAISFPSYLINVEQWMKQSEQQAKELTTAFLTMNNKVDFMFVFIIVAIIPAIGEELLFRGVLQKLLQRWIKKPHLAIWITAIIFSALHLQFYGFLPRMLLGALFGYLFYWSNSLWLPILAHLFNNGSVVTVSYFYPEQINESEIISLSNSETTNLILAALSLIFTLVLLYYFKTKNNKIREEKRY